MQKHVIVATTSNSGKIAEIKQIFKNYSIQSSKELGITLDIDENEETFTGNALKKAKSYAKEIPSVICIADDSGIEIEALDGFPGVRTARFMKGTDHERNIAILEKMKGLPKEKRKVSFITAIAMADDKISVVEQHIIHGYISTEPRGENGFGFDEIFELENGKTLAELTSEEKNLISARKFALEKIKKYLND